MPNAPFTKTGSTIVQMFAAAAQAVSKTLLDFTVGSVFLALGEATSVIADWLQKLYIFALLISRLQTSRGIWVDTFTVDFMPPVAGSVTTALPNGSPRLPATAANGLVTFSRGAPQSQAVIPIGTLVTTFDGAQVFQVYADTTNAAYNPTIIPGGAYVISPGTVSLNAPVTALAAGSAGNVIAGAITLLRSPLVGVDSVTNPVKFDTGLDFESDDALKARFKLYILSLRAGTAEAIEYQIISLQQGLQVSVHNNVDPTGATDNGFVTVYVDNGTGSTPPPLVMAAAAAVSTVDAAGVRVAVLAATIMPAGASLTIAVAPGYYKPTVDAAVANAVGAYIQALQLEQELPYTLIEHLAYSASPGVINVSNVLLNNGTADLVPPMGQTIKLSNTGIVVS